MDAGQVAAARRGWGVEGLTQCSRPLWTWPAPEATNPASGPGNARNRARRAPPTDPPRPISWSNIAPAPMAKRWQMSPTAYSHSHRYSQNGKT